MERANPFALTAIVRQLWLPDGGVAPCRNPMIEDHEIPAAGRLQEDAMLQMVDAWTKWMIALSFDLWRYPGAAGKEREPR